MIDINSIEPKTNHVVLEIVERIETKIGSMYIPDVALKSGRCIEGVIHKIGSNCDDCLKIGQSVYFDISKSVFNDGNIVICPEKYIYGILED